MAELKQTKAQLLDALRRSQIQIAVLQEEVAAKREVEATLQTKETELVKIREALAEETKKIAESEKKLSLQQAEYHTFLDHSDEGI